MSVPDFPNRVKIIFKWAHGKPIVRPVTNGRAGYTCAPSSQIVGQQYKALAPQRPRTSQMGGNGVLGLEHSRLTAKEITRRGCAPTILPRR